MTNPKLILAVDSALEAELAKPIFIGEIEAAISAIIGILLYPGNGTIAEEQIRYADKARYRVKRAGKNSFGFVNPGKF